MKKVVDVNIGGISFSIEDDAYFLLKNYLVRFEATVTDTDEVKEVMEDVEIRVAEIFHKEIKYPNQVIDSRLVRIVINCLGEIEPDANTAFSSQVNQDDSTFNNTSGGSKKLYRNPDDTKIAGVCSGLAAYFSIDVTLVRIIFLVFFLGGGSAFVCYIILWLIIPKANTIVQKLIMRGVPVTAENIRNYYKNYRV